MVTCRRSRHLQKPSHAAHQTRKGPALDPLLAAYLLSIVGHVVERECREEEQRSDLAAQAVTVYNLIRQVGIEIEAK